MTDIVERLRAGPLSGDPVFEEAAAEIERLRAAWQASIDERGELLAEVERLREALRQLQPTDPFQDQLS